jgi:hypothetical protein
MFSTNRCRVCSLVKSEAWYGLTDLHLFNGGHFNHPIEQRATQTQLKEDGKKIFLYCFSRYSEHPISVTRQRGRKHLDKQISVCCLEALENTHKHDNASNYLYTQIKFNSPLEYKYTSPWHAQPFKTSKHISKFTEINNGIYYLMGINTDRRNISGNFLQALNALDMSRMRHAEDGCSIFHFFTDLWQRVCVK